MMNMRPFILEVMNDKKTEETDGNYHKEAELNQQKWKRWQQLCVNYNSFNLNWYIYKWHLYILISERYMYVRQGKNK